MGAAEVWVTAPGYGSSCQAHGGEGQRALCPACGIGMGRATWPPGEGGGYWCSRPSRSDIYCRSPAHPDLVPSLRLLFWLHPPCSAFGQYPHLSAQTPIACQLRVERSSPKGPFHSISFWNTSEGQVGPGHTCCTPDPLAGLSWFA